MLSEGVDVPALDAIMFMHPRKSRIDGLAHFQIAYPGQEINKEDLFYFIYGLLHSPEYRERFKNNLAKQIPRIPAVKSFDVFAVFRGVWFIFLGQAAATRQALQSRKSARRLFSRQHLTANRALAPALDQRHPDGGTPRPVPCLP